MLSTHTWSAAVAPAKAAAPAPAQAPAAAPAVRVCRAALPYSSCTATDELIGDWWLQEAAVPAAAAPKAAAPKADDIVTNKAELEVAAAKAECLTAITDR